MEQKINNKYITASLNHTGNMFYSRHERGDEV